MAMQQGEKYACPQCECEIEVTKGANPMGGDLKPQCCCGATMQPVE